MTGWKPSRVLALTLPAFMCVILLPTSASAYAEPRHASPWGGMRTEGPRTAVMLTSLGQPRRSLDVSRAARDLGFRARMDFREGLARTIAWYRERPRPARLGPD